MNYINHKFNNKTYDESDEFSDLKNHGKSPAHRVFYHDHE